MPTISQPAASREVDLPSWRSLLYIPVTNDKFVSSAHTRGADALILDLEDSVALSRKDDARLLVAAAADKVAAGGADVLVRVNRPWRMAIRDIEAVISPRILALMLPKVPNAQHVRALAEIVAELESERGMEVGATKFVILVETAQAYPRMEEIAHADPRVVAISLGSEDFSATCGMVPNDDALYVPKMQLLIFAHAAGIVPLGFIGSIADYQDLDGLRATAQRARRLGYMGAACVHPAQVPILNQAYGATPEELDQARRIIAAASRAATSGVGAYVIDGKMVDFPVVERARRIVARDDAIQKRGPEQSK